MGARNTVKNRDVVPTHRLAESISWKRFLGSLKFKTPSPITEEKGMKKVEYKSFFEYSQKYKINPTVNIEI
jgi:hypothetical protein